MIMIFYQCTQKLVEQFLKRVDGGLKREIYYWHAYYVSSTPLFFNFYLRKTNIWSNPRPFSGQKTPNWNKRSLKIRR